MTSRSDERGLDLARWEYNICRTCPLEDCQPDSIDCRLNPTCRHFARRVAVHLHEHSPPLEKILELFSLKSWQAVVWHKKLCRDHYIHVNERSPYGLASSE